MDTSETYIKMCEKAEEIQEHYRKKYSHPFCSDGAGYLMDSASNYLYRIKVGDDTIWLPRQDQLQEMVIVKTHPMPILNLGWRFQTFFNEQYSELNQATPPALFTSMEQLWLAFVMKEKYNKIWDADKIVWMSG